MKNIRLIKIVLNQKNLLIILGTVIIISIIVGIVIFISVRHKSLNIPNINNLEVSSQANNTTEKLIYTSLNQDEHSIWETDVSGKTTRLFTDKDEDLKIVRFGGLAYLDQEALVQVGQGPIYKLEIIRLDGSGSKKVIVDSFGDSLLLALCPDGEMIAYIVSSGDKNNDYYLYTISRQGNNRRKILTIPKEVTSISWNNNSTKIAYSSVSQDSQSEINIVDLESGNSEVVYTSSGDIRSLTWNQDNQLIFTEAYNKLATGKIIMIDSKGKNNDELYSSKEGLPIYGSVSQDNLNFALVNDYFDNGFDRNKIGELNVFNKYGDSIKKIKDVNIILGWL